LFNNSSRGGGVKGAACELSYFEVDFLTVFLGVDALEEHERLHDVLLRVPELDDCFFSG